MIARLRDWLVACYGDGIRNALCGHCHVRPTMADDCGFFFTEPDGTPCCEHCWHGAPGAAHRAEHGLGER